MNKPEVYEVTPSIRVGSFILGTPISFILELVWEMGTCAKILYDQNDPLKRDIVIRLDNGVILHFEPISQRLKLIEICGDSDVVLQFDETNFSGGDIDATFIKIYGLFGPSYPGKFDASNGEYHLSYPGLSFVFPVPSKYIQHYQNNPDELPIKFPDNTTPSLSRAYVFSGRTLGTLKIPQMPSSKQDPRIRKEFSNYFEEIEVELGLGIHFKGSRIKLAFFESVQDVVIKMGKPQRIFYKKHNKLRIHQMSPGGAKKQGIANQTTGVDYFYNYFKFGIDVMFDGNTHEIRKFILHTNFPGSKDFHQYRKCKFTIPVNQFRRKNDRTNYPIEIHQDMKFGEIVREFERMGVRGSQPLVNDSSSANNPFGGTRFFAFEKCIFEVLKSGYLNSVCLFVE